MGQEEIQDKLRHFFQNEHPFQEEKDVVYFLVETRKVLDHMQNDGVMVFPVLRFYCDWALHTNKTHITPEIEAIMKNIERDGLRLNESSETLNRFIKMEQLRQEVVNFCDAAMLVTEVLKNDLVWQNFHGLLMQVLSDQPILILHQN